MECLAVEETAALLDHDRELTYLERKLHPTLCTVRYCKRSRWREGQKCRKHTLAGRKADRKYRRRVRAELEASAKCGTCESPKKPGQRCPVCRVRRDRVTATDAAVDNKVDDSKDPWRRDNDGWKRYRGKGKRGSPGVAASDELDLKIATDAVERGRKALAYARSPEVAALPRIQRRGVIAEATSLLAHAARAIDDVVDRYQQKAKEP